ncbi:MAG: hypothetical protein ABF293_06250 [Flavobacteriaceae bacterium]
MKSADLLPHSPRSTNSNNIIHRLERINKNLLSLRTKLNSYICEPKTLSLYQKMESLKSHLDDMHGNNTELISNLRSRSLLLKEGKVMVKQQFEAYKNLEVKVMEYIGMAKMHC